MSKVIIKETDSQVVEWAKRMLNGGYNANYTKLTVYNDGVWDLTLEVTPNKTLRWIAEREDRAGNFNSSFITVYESNGKILYTAGFKIRKDLVQKVCRIYKLYKQTMHFV